MMHLKGAKVEFHMFVENSKFPTKALRAAHAAIILLDAAKTWKEN